MKLVDRSEKWIKRVKKYSFALEDNKIDVTLMGNIKLKWYFENDECQ